MDATNKAVPDEFAGLRKLAEAATPGPWSVNTACGMTNGKLTTDEVYVYSPEKRNVAIASDVADPDTGEMSEPNAQFIAAANPATILRLLDALENECKWRDEAIIDLSGKLVESEESHSELVGKFNRAIGVSTFMGEPATHPQPVAVSAPSDERAAFEAWASSNGFQIKLRDDGPDTYFAYETEQRWFVWQAARAAAPVSGPSEVERLTMELQNQREITQHWKMKAISAAPVSGQGASIRDDTELMAYLANFRNCDEKSRAYKFLDAAIERIDSRAKVLESAAQACENERVEDTGSEGDIGYNMAIKHCAATIRALASTTPQKADNEK